MTDVIIRMPVLRMLTKAPRKNDISGYLRLFEVENLAIKTISEVEDVHRILAAARLAHERLRYIARLRGGAAWAFPISAAEVEVLARAERLFGTGHQEGEQEVARLDALPCEPYADEVACGLFNAVRWLMHPARIVRFGFTADQGARL